MTIKLDRIVCQQRITRKRHIWWQYTIADDKIYLRTIKGGYPKFGELFIALMRDVPFCRHYFSEDFIVDKYITLESGIFGTGGKKDVTHHLWAYIDQDDEDINVINLSDEYEFKEPLIYPIDKLIQIFNMLYSDYIDEYIIQDKRYYKLNTVELYDKNWYKRSYSELFVRFNKMDEEKLPYILSKHFGGFTKKDSKLEVFNYNMCTMWDKKDERGIKYRDVIKKKFGGLLSSFYIVYYADGCTIDTTRVEDKFLKKLLGEFTNKNEQIKK